MVIGDQALLDFSVVVVYTGESGRSEPATKSVGRYSPYVLGKRVSPQER